MVKGALMGVLALTKLSGKVRSFAGHQLKPSFMVGILWKR
jgi:hypothetical protein